MLADLVTFLAARRFSYQIMNMKGANRMKSASIASGRLSNSAAAIVALAIKKTT
ncbi:hypothetical protein L485_08770 [Sphingobium baderi LL03]|uniref:Uncharacterized protein n=1 Tax=Sphingobium baderi LL03 TaxID=1114964 RepID=T0HWZ5_9SPHN|nr:hypothetical protein L485_08770 [Sphingobium baderi LL03]